MLVVFAMIVATTAQGGGMAKLREQKDLTPEGLLRSCSAFKYELSRNVQDPEAFLERQRGDCDDFANFAQNVLSERGYTTKLVVVAMDGQAHVVCYVKESHGFLDFNQRTKAEPIIASDGSLEDIAVKVSGFFRSRWLSASEFKFQGRRPVYLKTVLH